MLEGLRAESIFLFGTYLLVLLFRSLNTTQVPKGLKLPKFQIQKKLCGAGHVDYI